MQVSRLTAATHPRATGLPTQVAVLVVAALLGLLVGVVLYLIPRTAMFGTAILTAYMGGAVATHLRMSEYPQSMAPIVFAVVMWVALVLRDGRVRAAVFG